MRKYPVIAFVLIFTGFGAFWTYGNITPKTPANIIEASGTIEAESISVTSEVGGRVAEIVADEGQTAQPGQILVRLDDALLIAQQTQADAAVATAEAALAKIKAGARSEDVDGARAALAQAVAASSGAKSAWESAALVRDNPQDLTARIDSAAARVESAQAQLNLAKAGQAVAEANRDEYEWKVAGPDRSRYLAYVEDVKAAEERVKAATATLEGAKKDLENLKQMKDNPQGANAEVNGAKARYDTAKAAVSVAQARLAALAKGASAETLAISEAQLKQAQATRDTLDVMKQKLSPTAPTGGIVMRRTASLGETVQPGTVIMTLANLERVTLKVYIAEDQLGHVRIGQRVQIKSDSFPGQKFDGQVFSISNSAEFTPRNVQTKDQRVNTVYAVKIRIPNSSLKLKPGTPADAQIQID